MGEVVEVDVEVRGSNVGVKAEVIKVENSGYNLLLPNGTTMKSVKKRELSPWHRRHGWAEEEWDDGLEAEEGDETCNTDKV